MKNKRRSTIAGAFGLIGRYQPAYYGWAVPLIFVSSVIPLAGVWMPRLLLALLTEEQEYRDILTVIGVYGGILMTAYLLKNILTWRTELSIAGCKAALQLEIGKTAMNAELKEIENASYKEEILMAANVSELSDIMTSIRALLSAAVTILGLGAILIRVNLFFFLLVGLTLGIKVALSVIRFRCNARRRVEMAENDKVGGYLDYLQYYAPGAAKEVRVNHAQSWMNGKISAFRDKMVELQLRSFSQYRLFEAFQSLAFAVQNILILLVLADYYRKGNLSIADFSLYFSAVTLLSATLLKVTDQMFDFGQKLLSCGDFECILQTGVPRKADNKVSDSGKEEKIEKIRFENVSFSYPGTKTKVLENVSFELCMGDRAMLAGRNGSGKTTVIKLLCRFYEPDTGKIYVNDTDIATVPPERYYALIAAVFQDFSVFSFPIQENVAMKPEEQLDSPKLRSCLEKARLGQAVDSLPEKERTHLTRLFSDTGVELSGGEKQRLGIARALYKDAQILVLDEPAANLDPGMEEELYRNFYDMTEGKISLTVSHRLSQSSVSNKIFVLDQGIICETGTHRELMEKDGIYADMFRKQREAYVMND